jgi:uncharacterized Fe-S radical SAM superfamily protein PflX
LFHPLFDFDSTVMEALSGETTGCVDPYVEEIEILPSYMVYFSGCNFRCGFCVQAPECFDADRGARVDPASLATMCNAMVGRGAKTINLLGGEPSLHLHAILDLAAAAWPARFSSC